MSTWLSCLSTTTSQRSDLAKALRFEATLGAYGSGRMCSCGYWFVPSKSDAFRETHVRGCSPR